MIPVSGTITTLRSLARYVGGMQATGALVIRLPPSHTDAAYVLHVDGQTYAPGRSGWGLVCSGYANRSAGAWTGTCFHARGSLPHTRVRFGFDRKAGVCCVAVGDASSVWPLPGITLARVDAFAAREPLMHGWRLGIEDIGGILFQGGGGGDIA